MYRRTGGLWITDSTVKGLTRNLTWSETKRKGNNLNGADLFADLGGPLERREATGTLLGDLDGGGSHFEELVLP